MKYVSLLEWKKFPEGKRLDIITKMYFYFCTEKQIYKNGKPNKDYFCVKAFFRKQDQATLNILYNYLLTIAPERQIKSLSEVLRDAEGYRASEIRKTSSEPVKAKLEHLSIEEVLNW